MSKGSKKKTIKLNKKTIMIGVSIILVIGIIISCIFIFGNNKDEQTGENEVKIVLPENNLKIVDLNSKSRPYAVMINNLGTARPLQSGLQDAMIIYEIIVEGGLTRYMAVFQDQSTARIGSIRSARHYFLDYALENDAIYVHHGRSPQALEDFSKLGVDRIEVSDSTGWRDKTLGVSTEHTLFTNIEKLNNGIGSKRTTRNKDYLLNYSKDEVDISKLEGAKVANNVSITYSGSVTSSYTYDAENKVYLRSVNGKAHTDYVTGKQYTFKNIITYQVDNEDIPGDYKHRQNVNTVGNGTGYYITDGYAVPITWEKKSRSEQTVYKYTDGTEIKVNDGNTFIQIQPKNKELVIN